MLNGTRKDRGQVLIIFVFAIVGLIGITGLAVDGGNIYSDRRHAQNAADAASLSAAVIKINQQKNGASGCTDITTPTACGAKVKNAALDMAAANGYTGDLVHDTVEVHIPPIDGPYSDCTSYAFRCTDYIEVIISTNVDTFFARVLGITQLHNRVEAVALARFSPTGHLYSGSSLVELSPTSSNCNGDVYFGGSGTITLNGGGVFVNSNNPTCAFKETKTCPTVILNGATIQGVGGQFPGCASPVMQKAASQYPFPPDELFPAPAECSQAPKPSTLDADGYTHLYPGHYSSLPPAKNTRLEPNGVYCVDTLIKTTNPNSNFVGQGVFIYIKPDGAFSFQGGTINLTAPTSGQYAGYLLYVASDYQGNPQNCNINAGSGDTISGVIYAPYCALTINGASGSVGFSAQVIAYTIDLEGSANLIFNYDQNSSPTVPEYDRTGLYH